MIKVKEWDNIPLNLQLWNGVTDKVIKATLRDLSNPTTIIIDNIILTHHNEWLYLNNNVTMTDTYKYITAIIKIYQSDGVTLYTSAGWWIYQINLMKY